MPFKPGNQLAKKRNKIAGSRKSKETKPQESIEAAYTKKRIEANQAWFLVDY